MKFLLTKTDVNLLAQAGEIQPGDVRKLERAKKEEQNLSIKTRNLGQICLVYPPKVYDLPELQENLERNYRYWACVDKPEKIKKVLPSKTDFNTRLVE